LSHDAGGEIQNTDLASGDLVIQDHHLGKQIRRDGPLAVGISMLPGRASRPLNAKARGTWATLTISKNARQHSIKAQMDIPPGKKSIVDFLKNVSREETSSFTVEVKMMPRGYGVPRWPGNRTLRRGPRNHAGYCPVPIPSFIRNLKASKYSLDMDISKITPDRSKVEQKASRIINALYHT